nr:hypothetical protein [Scytonema hofmannii]
MKHLYTLLFSLSIILINPWGAMRGEIWTQPKVFVILLICIFNFLMVWEERCELKIPQSWKLSKLLWELFLGIGLISTLTSPFPLRSLLGQEQMGDGLLYWILIAIFTLSNTLLLRLHPELARSQLQGLVIGGVVLAISIFPQVIDWKIDYTATMGQLFRENILASTIFHAPTANRLVLPQGSCIKSTCSRRERNTCWLAVAVDKYSGCCSSQYPHYPCAIINPNQSRIISPDGSSCLLTRTQALQVVSPRHSSMSVGNWHDHDYQTS